jgi:hypothetical protein
MQLVGSLTTEPTKETRRYRKKWYLVLELMKADKRSWGDKANITINDTVNHSQERMLVYVLHVIVKIKCSVNANIYCIELGVRFYYNPLLYVSPAPEKISSITKISPKEYRLARTTRKI